MRRNVLKSVAVVGVILAAGCDRDREALPTQPVLQETAALTCDQPRIDQLVAALYPAGKARDGARAKVRAIYTKLAQGKTADARQKMFDLLKTTLADLAAGKLLNPLGTLGLTTQAAVSELFNRLYACVGLEAPGDISGALGSGGGAAVVVPSASTTQTVTTGDGQAAASFPPGAVDQPVLVVIAPSADQTDPLPTGLTQFPPFYDFVTSPAVTFGQPVTIGICVNYGDAPQEVLDRLQLARPDVTGGTTLELLPRVAPPAGLGCDPLPGLTAAVVPSAEETPGVFGRLFTGVRTLVRPAPLHAATLVQVEGIGGLGGTVGNFGDNPVGAVEAETAACVGVTEIPSSECEALVALYNATGGPNWTNRTNWLQTSDVCSWYGVSCGDGRVRVLFLWYNGLTGVLPTELGDLTGLVTLQLDSNQLSGAIPAALGNLSQLRSLAVSWNSLSGAIPDALGNLTSLEVMWAGQNQLSGPIPATLGNLAALKYLYLSGNQLTGSIPAELGDLVSLENLLLSYNQLGGTIPATLGNLQNLQSLFLSQNQLTGSIPAEFGSLSSLKYLDVSFNLLTGGIPEELGNLSELDWLRLEENQLSGLVPLAVAQRLGGWPDNAGNCTFRPGNPGLYILDTPDYRAADGNGDGFICGVPIGVPIFNSLGAGYSHTCGLTAAGTVFCWGLNQSGRLGDGTTTSHHAPIAVQMPAGVTFASIAVGAGFTCGLTTSGAPYCWGENFYGQVGDGTTTDRFTPVPVVMPSGVAFASLSAFGSHACGLTAAGAAYCWGYNFHGQLGDGTTTNRTTPVAVVMPPGVTRFHTVLPGEVHTCGVADGKVAYCWGENGLGQLGDGTTTNQSTPVAVAGPLDLGVADSLAAGGAHTCGLKEFVGLYCWGWNGSGQLGDGTTTNHATPVPIAAPTGQLFSGVSAGGVHTCALTYLSTVYCWGDNRDGQVGDGTTTNRSTPVPVQVPSGVTFTSLALSAYHSCGLTPAGKAYCWGDNSHGQLGDGTTTDRWLPTPVGQ